MDLRLVTRVTGDSTVVAVGGEIDNFTAPQLWDALFDAGAMHAVVDLSQTDFLDSSALGVLVGISKRQQGAGGRLSIVCPKPHLRRIFDISHLDDVIPVYDTLEAATEQSRPA